MPSGTAPASSGTAGGVSTPASNPSTAITTNPAGTTTIPAGTVNTALPGPTTATVVITAAPAATSPLNPLARNGAEVVGVSLAFVVGVVGVVAAALF